MIEKDDPSIQIRVYTLGELSVERRQQDGTWEAVASSEWGPTTYGMHTKSLLGYLLSCYKRQAPRSAILEALWVNNPMCVDDYLMRATSRLRTLLRDEQAFRLSTNRLKYELADQARVWVDADHCEELYREATRVGHTTTQGLALFEEAEVHFRRGKFLEEETGIWAHGRRGKLGSLFYDCLLCLMEANEVQGQFLQSERVAETLLHDDATDENALCHLMLALHQQGKTSEALRRYQETCLLLNQAGRRCAPETEKLVKRLQQEP